MCSCARVTGWQLLAKQVRKDEDEEDSAADSSSDGDDAEAETDNSRQRLHLRSLSNTSTLSEESGLGSTACVTPRPHQWLYKEYKILDEIGSGGFGRVCRCDQAHKTSCSWIDKHVRALLELSGAGSSLGRHCHYDVTLHAAVFCHGI